MALSRRGWRVTVCERAPAVTGIGAGIVLAPNALRALHSIGLGPAVSEGEPLAGALGLRTPDGAWLSRTGAAASRYGLPARAVHRGFLIDALAAALPTDALRLGVPVSGVDDGGDAVVVRTPEGEMRADAVVAADGLRSVLRGQLFPGTPVRATPVRPAGVRCCPAPACPRCRRPRRGGEGSGSGSSPSSTAGSMCTRPPSPGPVRGRPTTSLS